MGLCACVLVCVRLCDCVFAFVGEGVARAVPPPPPSPLTSAKIQIITCPTFGFCKLILTDRFIVSVIRRVK